jgi:hypothetical protein
MAAELLRPNSEIASDGFNIASVGGAPADTWGDQDDDTYMGGTSTSGTGSSNATRSVGLPSSGLNPADGSSTDGAWISVRATGIGVMDVSVYSGANELMTLNVDAQSVSLQEYGESALSQASWPVNAKPDRVDVVVTSGTVTVMEIAVGYESGAVVRRRQAASQSMFWGGS